MNKKKTLFMSLVIVLLVGLMVSAGTFAYFQWTTDASQRTNVNVTIAAGGIKMIMTPEGGVLEAKGLKPVADCMESYAYFDTKIQIQNTTGSLVVPSFKLKARVKPNSAANAGTLKKADLSHIHYTVVEIDRMGQEIKADKADNTGARRCYEPSHIQKEGTGREGLFVDTSNDTTIATGTFANMSQVLDADGWTSAINLPSADNVYLARQYNDDPVKGDTGTFGITFMGDIADSTGMRLTNRYFRVYVWIDAGYTYTNAGTNMADPMNNAIIEVTWSEDSIVQQVTGSVNRQPGLYDLSGNYTSWDMLVSNGDITLSDTTITASSEDLTGDLVIPEGITQVGTGLGNSSSVASGLSSVYIPSSVTIIQMYSLSGNSDLKEVEFAPGSQLSNIGSYAFKETKIVNITIPNGVTSIGYGSFPSTLISANYDGTVEQWKLIDVASDFASPAFSSGTTIICTDGIVVIE